MMTDKEVKRYEAIDYDLVLEFMKKVTTLETVNPQIIEQSILIKQFDKVSGMVSFEAFDQVGIIRYFIYDQNIVPDLLVNMFFELYRSAKEKEINIIKAVEISTKMNKVGIHVLGYNFDINNGDLKSKLL